MREVVERLEAGAQHATLCVNPSPHLGGGAFDRDAMAAQLRAFALPTLARALASGLPEQLSTAAFLGRYRCLAPINEARLHQGFLLHSASSLDELRQGCAALLATLPLRPDECSLGLAAGSKGPPSRPRTARHRPPRTIRGLGPLLRIPRSAARAAGRLGVALIARLAPLQS